MTDFDREWARMQRRHDRARLMITASVIITWAFTAAMIGFIGFLGFKAAKAGPEAIAAQAGRAVAAFESARDSR